MGRLVNISEPPFLHLENGHNDNTHFTGFQLGLNEIDMYHTCYIVNLH